MHRLVIAPLIPLGVHAVLVTVPELVNGPIPIMSTSFT